MKRLFIITLTVILNFAFFSCNPERLFTEEVPQACCGEGSEIPPPPPPPPTDLED